MTRYCNNCGSPVSNKYHRLYADNAGNLSACINCADSLADARYDAQGRDRKDSYSHGNYRR